MAIDIASATQNTGILKNYIQRTPETKKKNNNIETTFEETTEIIGSIKETSSRAVGEYNPDGHPRNDYDLKKHEIDISA